MKYISILFMLLGVALFQGCKDEINSTDLQKENTGNIQFKIDIKNAPENVATVTATLTRTGFETINSSLNLLTDSSASIDLSDIPEGKWFLDVKAFDQNQKLIYKGEDEINVVSSTTIQVSLILYPVSQGLGNVNIYVTWGNYQAQWIDYSSNPLIKSDMFPNNPPKVSEGKVIYHNGKYKMWYNVVLSGAKSSIYYAESLDGFNWTVSTQAALESTYSSWDNKSVLIGGVVVEDSCLRMFYSGADYSGNLSIGMAVSKDGKTWIKSPQPLFSNPSGLNVMGVNSALKVNNEYYLYLSVGRINYLAKSSSLSTWNFYKDILVSGNWDYDGAIYTSVIYKNQTFQMIYQVPLNPSFYMATSTDGIVWNKNETPIFNNNSIAWANAIAYPNYFIKNNEERIYYTGTSKTTGYDNIALIYKR